MCIQRLIRFILNMLLLMVAITAMLACTTKADIYSKMVHVALAVACVSAAFSKRYVQPILSAINSRQLRLLY